MIWQLILQLLEIQASILLVINLLLIVPQLHEIGEVEGHISQVGLVVFMEDLLGILHVLEG